MAPAPSEIYTLSLHDALPISGGHVRGEPVSATRVAHWLWGASAAARVARVPLIPLAGAYWALMKLRARSEEHTSELQSPDHLVCRLLLEKKKKKTRTAERRAN